MITSRLLLRFLTNRTTLIIALLIVSLLLFRANIGIKENLDRVTDNYEVSQGLLKADLILTESELDKFIEKSEWLERALKDSLEIKNKQIQRLTTVSGKTEIRYRDRLRDTVVYDTVTDTIYLARTFHYSDKWITSKGIVFGDSVDIYLESRDTLAVVNYWYKEGTWFLPKLFRPRKYRTSVVGNSPYNYYSVQQSVEVLKRK